MYFSPMGSPVTNMGSGIRWIFSKIGWINERMHTWTKWSLTWVLKDEWWQSDRKGEGRKGSLNRGAPWAETWRHQASGTFGELRVAEIDWDVGCKSGRQSTRSWGPSASRIHTSEAFSLRIHWGLKGTKYSFSSKDVLLFWFVPVESVQIMHWFGRTLKPFQYVYLWKKTSKKYSWFKSQFKGKKHVSLIKEAL